MRSVSIRLIDMPKSVIPIGFVGENQHTQVNIDCKKVFDEYPTAAAGLTVQPPQGAAYPAVTVRDGDIVTWTVTDSDLIRQGTGEIQLAFTVDEVVVKSFIGRIRIDRSIVPTGEIPEPVDNWLTEANATLAEIPQTISESVDAALEEAKESGEFDGPQGPEGPRGPEGPSGKDGSPGKDGQDGYTPVKGVDYFDGQDGKDGKDGQDGSPGADGYSPTATVTKSGKVATITITDKNGTTSETVSDGADADPSALIDDTAGSGVTNKCWSADKLTSALSDKYEKPASGIPASDLASGVIPSVPVTDVQINGNSILSNGVANVPLSGQFQLGVVKTGYSSTGIFVASDGTIYVSPANDATVKSGNGTYTPVTPTTQHAAAFYGLAKAAGDTSQSSSSNAVGVYTADALVKIQKMLGIYEAPWELIREDTFTNATEANHEITVDGNGNAFELTSIRMVLWFPTQNNEAKTAAGLYVLTDTDNNETQITSDSKTVSANSSVQVALASLEQDHGMFVKTSTPFAADGNLNFLRIKLKQDKTATTYPYYCGAEKAFNKISIRAVTGTMGYRIYGKRKWT